MKCWLNKLLLVGWMDGTSTCDTNRIQNKFEFTLVYSSVFLFAVVAIIQLLSRVPLFETPWTVGHMAPLSMGFSRQEYWSGLPCPPPGDFPNQGIEPRFPALRADSLPSEPPGKPRNTGVGSLSLLQGNFPTQESNLHC